MSTCFWSTFPVERLPDPKQAKAWTPTPNRGLARVGVQALACPGTGHPSGRSFAGLGFSGLPGSAPAAAIQACVLLPIQEASGTALKWKTLKRMRLAGKLAAGAVTTLNSGLAPPARLPALAAAG